MIEQIGQLILLPDSCCAAKQDALEAKHKLESELFDARAELATFDFTLSRRSRIRKARLMRPRLRQDSQLGEVISVIPEDDVVTHDYNVSSLCVYDGEQIRVLSLRISGILGSNSADDGLVVIFIRGDYVFAEITEVPLSMCLRGDNISIEVSEDPMDVCPRGDNISVAGVEAQLGMCAVSNNPDGDLMRFDRTLKMITTVT
jgi:hypothetical protein